MQLVNNNYDDSSTLTAEIIDANDGKQDAGQSEENLSEFYINVNNDNQQNDNKEEPQKNDELNAVSGDNELKKIEEIKAFAPIIIGICAVSVIIMAIAIATRKKK